MVSTATHSRPDAIAVVARAGLLGLWAGAGVGAVAGSILVPVLGTLVGLVLGSAYGGMVGLGNGLVLAALAACTRPSQVVVRLVASVVSGTLTALVAGQAAGGEFPGAGVSIAMAAVGALLGLALGPRALRTAEPACSLVGMSIARGAGVGVLVGSLAGAVAGVCWGLHVYPPTAWFAGLEVGGAGAIVGVTFGTALGGAAALRVWHHGRHHRGHPA